MKKHENRFTSKRAGILAQYSAAMVFLLAIGYILIITNPPSELLRYDENENMIVTKHLSISEMQEHGGSILVFLILFGLLSLFIGLLTSSIYEMEKEPVKHIYFIGSVFLVLVLGILLYPYYGNLLSTIALPVGYSAYLIGIFCSSPSFRAQFSASWVMVIVSMLVLSIMAITYLVFKILPASIAIAMLLLAIAMLLLAFIPLGLAIGLALWTLIKQVYKTLRKWASRIKIGVEIIG